MQSTVATVVGKNAQLVALSIVGFCLAEGINQLVIDSQLVAKCQIRNFIPNYWKVDRFRIILKTFWA